MIEELRTRGFRNLRDQDFRPGAGRHVILGTNGAGKTSLIEALYVAATTRSFRTADLTRCRRHGLGGFEVIVTVGGDRPARLRLAKSEGGLERSVDGNRGRLSAHLEVLPIVPLSEADRQVLGGDPGARRRFLDRGVIAERPRLVETVARYRQALEAKRLVLRRQGRDLAAWNTLLAREGSDLVAARRAHLELVRVQLAELGDRCGLTGVVGLAYQPSPALLGETPTSELEVTLARHLEQAANRELESGRTMVGPHRDRLTITWRGAEIATTASAGEKKLCGWVLALARAAVIASTGRHPTVLLDDADAELDPSRLALVWSLLDGRFDVYATSSRPEVWQSLEREATWLLEEGSVSALSP